MYKIFEEHEMAKMCRVIGKLLEINRTGLKTVHHFRHKFR